MSIMIQKKKNQNKKSGSVWLIKVLLVCVITILSGMTIQTSVASAAKLSLNKKTSTIYVGESIKLKTKKKQKKKITWISDNTAVATVGKSGKVEAVSPGTATITATCGKRKGSYKVTVSPKLLYFNDYYISAIVGESGKLDITAAPAAKTIKWSSSDKKIVKVDKNGIVTAVGAGTATITVKANDMEASLSVTVKENPYYFEKRSYVIFTGEDLSVQMGEYSYGSVNYTISKDKDGNIPVEENGPVYFMSGYSSAYLAGKADGIVYVKGTVSTYSSLKKENIEYTDVCKIYVCSKGITEQDSVLAEGVSHTFEMKNATGTVQWSTSNPSVIQVDPVTGVVNALAKGEAILFATVINTDGTKEIYETYVTVSAPTINKESAAVAKGASVLLKIKGRKAGSSKTEWTSSNPSVADVDENGKITAYGKGNVIISAMVDGKMLSCIVTVTEPSVKTTSFLLAKGKKGTIKIKGLDPASTVTYSSPNKKIATVTKEGIITAKKKGSVYIKITVDGMEYSCYVGVADKRAISAVKKAKKIINSSTYSQANRMQDGYYDCSALVWKGYGKYGYLLGDKNYAPVAANQAKYLEKKNKVISFNGYIDESKLAPGDLIFYGNEIYGSKDRYKYIYHVSMYCGNGLMIEKPLRSYLFNRDSIVLIARPI